MRLSGISARGRGYISTGAVLPPRGWAGLRQEVREGNPGEDAYANDEDGVAVDLGHVVSAVIAASPITAVTRCTRVVIAMPALAMAGSSQTAVDVEDQPPVHLLDQVTTQRRADAGGELHTALLCQATV